MSLEVLENYINKFLVRGTTGYKNAFRRADEKGNRNEFVSRKGVEGLKTNSPDFKVNGIGIDSVSDTLLVFL